MGSSSLLLAGLAVAALGMIATVVALLVVLRSRKERIGAEIAARYDEPLVPPELGMYRGGTGAFSSVQSTMWLALTSDVLALHPLLGGAPRVVSLAEVKGTRIERSWRGHWNGRPVLVVTTTRGELGITVAEPAEWEAALRRAMR